MREEEKVYPATIIIIPVLCMMPVTTQPTPLIAHQRPLITTDDTTPWYTLRLFNRNLRHITGYLDQQAMTYFVPMHYQERLNSQGKLERYLTPVVSNLLFLKKTETQQELVRRLDERQIKAHIVPKERGHQDAYEISSREMRELIYICDPDKVLYEIISADEAAMKPGAPVMVTHGPMKGYHGRLVRKHHHYYLLKLYTGFGVMVKVTKWCCKPMQENSQSPTANS